MKTFMNTNRRCGALWALALMCAPALAAELHVPASFPTIQAAVDAALVGDEVVLADGTYTGPGNTDVDFGGKDITVRSASGDPAECVIDLLSPNLFDAGRAFRFTSGETSAARVQGLTIANALLSGSNGTGSVGGALYIAGSNPTIVDCTFTGCVAYLGGAASLKSGASASFVGCSFQTCSSVSQGGAVYQDASSSAT